MVFDDPSAGESASFVGIPLESRATIFAFALAVFEYFVSCFFVHKNAPKRWRFAARRGAANRLKCLIEPESIHVDIASGGECFLCNFEHFGGDELGGAKELVFMITGKGVDKGAVGGIVEVQKTLRGLVTADIRAAFQPVGQAVASM